MGVIRAVSLNQRQKRPMKCLKFDSNGAAFNPLAISLPIISVEDYSSQ